MPARFRRLAPWLASFAPAILSAQAALAPQFPLQVASTRFYSANSAFGTLVDGAVASDGRTCVVDFSTPMVFCLRAGADSWTQIGSQGRRAGRNPGPYRIAFTPGNRMWIWDFLSQQASLYDAAGKFVGRGAFPYRFRQVDNMVALGEEELIVSGVASEASAEPDSAIHRFKWAGSGEPMKAVRAFAPLPPGKVREKIEHWGAGALTVSARGTLYYCRRVPYEIREYTVDGKLLRVIPGPVQLAVGPDQAVVIEETETQKTISQNGTIPIVYPLRAIDVGDRWILTGRRTYEGRKPALLVWDLLDRKTGKRVAESAVVTEMGESSGFAFDPAKLALWSIGINKDEEGVWQTRLKMHDPSRN